MAGRGTDIMLGGSSEVIAQKNLAAEGLDPKADPREYQRRGPWLLSDAEGRPSRLSEEVRELGGSAAGWSAN